MRLLLIILILIGEIAVYSQNEVRYRQCTSGCTEADSDDTLNADFNYNNIERFVSQDITSDYGFRNCSTCTNQWHKGVDYSSLENGFNHEDRGDALVSILSGRIKRVRGNTAYKYITVDSDTLMFGYGHIFRSELPDNAINGFLKSGKFILKKCETPYHRHYAIIDLEHCIGYSDIPDTALAFVILNGLDSSICNSDTIEITNHISANYDIAPLGSSGYVPTHLHLYRFKETAGTRLKSPTYNDNSGDPLYAVDHDIPTYDIKIKTANYKQNPFTLIDTVPLKFLYQGVFPQSMRIRTIMRDAENPPGDDDRFSNVAMNIDKVEFYLKRPFETDYELAQLLKDTSKVWLGASNDSIYPLRLTQSYGSWEKTGQYPYAYTEGDNRPYDDFYFYGFITQIHKNYTSANLIPYLADYPQIAKYNDGPYELKAVIVDVDSNISEGPTNTQGNFESVKDTLDNFLPFIEKVSVEINNEESYYGEFKFENPDPFFHVDGYTYPGLRTNPAISQLYPPYIGNNYQITVTASEPMDSMTIYIPELAQSPYYSIPPSSINSDHTVFTFGFTEDILSTYSYGYPQVDSCYTISIFGLDFKGNELLNFKSYIDNNQNQIYIPQRRDTTGNLVNDFEPDPIYFGTEEYHSFCIKECGITEFSGNESEANYHSGNNSRPNYINSNSPCVDVVEIISPSQYPNYNDGEIHLDIAESPVDQIIFYDGSGSVIKDGLDTFINNLTPGVYCYDIVYGCCELSSCVIVQECRNIKIALKNPKPNFICNLDTQLLNIYLRNTYYDEIDDTSKWDILWSDGSTETYNLFTGETDYSVTVTSSEGCEYQKSWRFEQPPLNFSAVLFPETCDNLGSISLQFLDTYDYIEWHDNGQNSTYRDNLSAGEYCASIFYEDSLCRIDTCFQVDEIKNLNIVLDSIKNPYCISEDRIYPEGLIEISIYGSQNYTVQWSGPSNFSSSQEDIYNLEPGTYWVTVETANGCIETRSFEVCCCSGWELPPVLLCDDDPSTIPTELEFSVFHATNQYSFDGLITITNLPVGHNFYIEWSGPNGFYSQNQNISNLEPGLYCVTVSSSCISISQCVQVYSCEDDLTLTEQINHTCDGYSVGSIKVNASGTPGPYQYQWSTGSTNNKISDLSPGIYTVTVTDDVGCTIIRDYEIIHIEPYRNGCKLLCGIEVIYEYGDEYPDTDPDDCGRVNIYCSEDDYFVRNEYVGYETLFAAGCEAQLINKVTRDICSTDSGEYCTECIFEIREFVDDGNDINDGVVGKDTVINCTIEYCYFPNLGINGTSHILFIDDHNSNYLTCATEVSCHYEVRNVCADTLHFKETVFDIPCDSCDDYFPFIREDCDQYYELHGTYDGRLGSSDNCQVNLASVENKDTVLSKNLAENRTQNIIVFPNPASDYLNIEIINSIKGDRFNIILTNTLGKNINKQSITNSKNGIFDFQIMHLSKFPSGIYFLQIRDESNEVLQSNKIIIE